MGNAAATVTPFRERLVAYWVNHFTASRQKGLAHAGAGHHAREAIRAPVTRRFSCMLIAVCRARY